MTAWGVCKSPKIVAPSQPATSPPPGLQRRKTRTAAHKAAVAAIPLPHASEPTANDIVDAASRVVVGAPHATLPLLAVAAYTDVHTCCIRVLLQSTLHACVAIALSLYMVLVDPEGPYVSQQRAVSGAWFLEPHQHSHHSCAPLPAEHWRRLWHAHTMRSTLPMRAWHMRNPCLSPHFVLTSLFSCFAVETLCCVSQQDTSSTTLHFVLYTEYVPPLADCYACAMQLTLCCRAGGYW